MRAFRKCSAKRVYAGDLCAYRAGYADRKRGPVALPEAATAGSLSHSHGGPIWASRDIAAWSIPKGVVSRNEEPLAGARREFREETGFAPEGDFLPLGSFRQNSTKNLTVWAIEGDCDPAELTSTLFSMVWPPKSGRLQQFPEADRGGWFDRKTALKKIVKGQRPVLDAFYGKMA